MAILRHNTIHHALTRSRCCKAGAVYLAINYLLRQDIAYCINHSESKLFIVEDALYDLVKDVLDEMPTVKTWIWSTAGRGQAARQRQIQGFRALVQGLSGHRARHGPPDRGPRPDDLHQRHRGAAQGGHHHEPGPHGRVHGLHRRRPVRRGRRPGQRASHLSLRPARRLPEPRLLGGRDEHPDRARHGSNPEKYLRLQGDHVLCAAHGLDRPAAAPRFREVRPQEPQEVLLRGIHHARGDPQGDHGEIPRVGNLELLRPDGACALSHGPQGQGRPAQAGLRGPGRHQHGDEARGRQLQSRLPGRVCRARSAARVPTP